MKNYLWKIVPRLEGKSVVTSRWIFKIKHATDESIEKYKQKFMVRWKWKISNLFTILSTLTQFAQTRTLTLLFCSPNLFCINEGLYRHNRWRETQKSPNKWFIILRGHYNTFTLALINTPFRYPSLADWELWISLSDWDEVWNIISWDILGGNPLGPM